MNKILTAKNNWHEIDNSDKEVADWFNNFELTQTHHILRQLNEERLYQPFFEGADGLTIVDIGANIGLFTLYVRDVAEKIVSVEPTPVTFKLLEKLTANETNVARTATALSDHDGTVDFYISDNPTINSAVNEVGTKVTVQARKIKTILDEQGLDYVDFIKCDIEGGEVAAITDATISEVADRVGFWALEVHQTDGHTGRAWPGNLEENRQNLAEVFKRNGYEVQSVEHDQLLAWK